MIFKKFYTQTKFFPFAKNAVNKILSDKISSPLNSFKLLSTSTFIAGTSYGIYNFVSQEVLHAKEKDSKKKYKNTLDTTNKDHGKSPATLKAEKENWKALNTIKSSFVTILDLLSFGIYSKVIKVIDHMYKIWNNLFKIDYDVLQKSVLGKESEIAADKDVIDHETEMYGDNSGVDDID